MTKALHLLCAEAKEAGAWKGQTDSDFLDYLVEIGLTRYRKLILPTERGDDLEDHAPRACRVLEYNPEAKAR